MLSPGSWKLEEVVSFQEGEAKGKRQRSEECPIGSVLSVLFSSQVVPLLLAHAMTMILTQAHEEKRQQATAARECHNALASEAQASQRVDVRDTTACCREFEHEGDM